MRIAFFVTVFPSVSETFVLNQITGLIDRGHEVDIYAEKPEENSKTHPDVQRYNLCNRVCYINKPKNILIQMFTVFKLLLTRFISNPIVLLKSLNVFKYRSAAYSLSLFYAAGYLLGQNRQYDIIHCHFGLNGRKAVYLREIGAIQGKIFTTFHGFDITTCIYNFGEKIYDSLFQLGDVFLPISERWKCRLTNLGCNGEIIVHRMGIDCNKFTFNLRKPSGSGVIEIVTIARLVEKKGVEYAIRAVAKVAKSKSNIKYSIVGDGLLKEDLQLLIEQLNVADIVKILGWKQQEEVVTILSNSDILLAPSVTAYNDDQEGIPVVIMETMAMGLPIISTQHSGIPELVQDGISGYLVPERDVDALAEKLDYLIEHPELWSSMGLAGRAFVEEHYNIDKLNDRLIEIFQNTVQPKKGSLKRFENQDFNLVMNKQN